MITWGSIGKHSKGLGLGQCGKVLQRARAAWGKILKGLGNVGKYSKGIGKHVAAF